MARGILEAGIALTVSAPAAHAAAFDLARVDGHATVYGATVHVIGTHNTLRCYFASTSSRCNKDDATSRIPDGKETQWNVLSMEALYSVARLTDRKR